MPYLPVKLRKTPGGYSITCGPDPRAVLYIYEEPDEKRVDGRHLPKGQAEAFAKAVALALREGSAGD